MPTTPAASQPSKLTKIAAICWIATAVYFPIQIFVASAWNPAYSWKNNYISSLGNTACGIYEDAFVCSPKHGLMNAGFVLIGLLIIAGSLLFARSIAQSKVSKTAFGLLAAGGIGTIIVGLAPENSNLDLHSLGALLPFLFGNIGILILGFSRTMLSQPLRLYSLVTGIIGITAFILFSSGIFFGLGVGGMERVVDYVQSIWFVVFGMTILVRYHTSN